jgi:DNA-binding Lrp family transcriptional regulator
VEAAFVLIKTERGAEMDVLADLRKVKGVNEAFVVYGAYDVIARLEAVTIQELREIILECIRKRDGIRTTLTMIVSTD